MLKASGDGQVYAQILLDLAHHGDDLDRVSSYAEEAVLSADLLWRNVEYISPNLCKLRRKSGTRLNSILLFLLTRYRQGLTVQFAVVGDRENFQCNEVRRDHVGGQKCRQLLMQGLAAYLGRGLVIACEEVVTRLVFLCQYCRLLNVWLLQDDLLDLSCLNTVATYFYLMVYAAEVLDVAIGHPAGKVSGAVELLAFFVRMVGEFLCSELRAVEVFSRQLHTGDA